MATLEELFAAGAKEVHQEVWTEDTEYVPEEEQQPGHEYCLDFVVSLTENGTYNAWHKYIGSRVKEN